MLIGYKTPSSSARRRPQGITPTVASPSASGSPFMVFSPTGKVGMLASCRELQKKQRGYIDTAEFELKTLHEELSQKREELDVQKLKIKEFDQSWEDFEAQTEAAVKQVEVEYQDYIEEETARITEAADEVRKAKIEEIEVTKYGEGRQAYEQSIQVPRAEHNRIAGEMKNLEHRIKVKQSEIEMHHERLQHQEVQERTLTTDMTSSPVPTTTDERSDVLNKLLSGVDLTNIDVIALQKSVKMITETDAKLFFDGDVKSMGRFLHLLKEGDLNKNKHFLAEYKAMVADPTSAFRRLRAKDRKGWNVADGETFDPVIRCNHLHHKEMMDRIVVYLLLEEDELEESSDSDSDSDNNNN